jgi:hypothetical protein
MVGEKLILAIEEFSKGKTIREILFSDNPGIVMRKGGPIVFHPGIYGATIYHPYQSTYKESLIKALQHKEGYTLKKPAWIRKIGR